MQEGTLFSPGNLKVTDRRGNVYARHCASRQLLDRMGDKWSVLVLLLLGENDMRFSVLKRKIDGVSQKMLSQTLRSLERDGFVNRHVEAGIPVSVRYSLTPLARELLTSLRFMLDWAETRVSEVMTARLKFDERSASM